MPELPEVECLSQAVSRALVGKQIKAIRFHRRDLRGPIPTQQLKASLCHKKVTAVRRRSKYMLWQTEEDVGIFHLGMTGNMRLFPTAKPQFPHTHVVFSLNDDQYLHYIDPRRFGRIDCCALDDLSDHPFFSALGPEPLGNQELGQHLFRVSRGKKQPVKAFLMDARVVVGVGNIYASESLFRAKLHPETPAGQISRQKYQVLSQHVQETLAEAIEAGGTTLKDFKSTEGEPGYFRIQLAVYGRKGQPCPRCQTPVEQLRQSGRSTFFCPRCQKPKPSAQR